MKDFSKLLESYYDLVKQIGIVHIINAFRKSILTELDFTQELNNIERFRTNFVGDSNVYVPITYKALSNDNILCMEFIDGIKITDKEKLKEAGLLPQKIDENLVNLYLKQVVDFGFFHADPHSGNIFIYRSEVY